jgi:hypothetical protein
VDVLYFTSTAFGSAALNAAALAIIVAPASWLCGIFAFRLPLSLGRLTNMIVYNDAHCENMRSVTPLVALDRATLQLDPGEQAPRTWWAATAPLLARMGRWRKHALAKADTAASQRGFKTWNAVAAGIRTTAVLFTSGAMLVCNALDGASMASYLCLRGPLLLRMDLLSHPAVANSFFLRSAADRLSHADLAYLFATRSASAALLGCIPMVALVFINSAVLDVRLVGYWANENALYSWSPVSSAAIAINGVTFAAVGTFFLVSFFTHRPAPEETKPLKVEDPQAEEDGFAAPEAASPEAPAELGRQQKTIFTRALERVVASMAEWDRIMLDDSIEASGATPQMVDPQEAEPPSILARKELKRPMARAASEMSFVAQSVADAEAAVASPESSTSPAIEGYVRHVLTENGVAVGLRVELKQGAPPRHRLDDPTRLLVAGQQGVLDEEGPCASPYVIWDGGMGRIFCHVEDLWLLQPKLTV